VTREVWRVATWGIRKVRAERSGCDSQQIVIRQETSPSSTAMLEVPGRSALQRDLLLASEKLTQGLSPVIMQSGPYIANDGLRSLNGV